MNETDFIIEIRSPAKFMADQQAKAIKKSIAVHTHTLKSDIVATTSEKGPQLFVRTLTFCDVVWNQEGEQLRLIATKKGVKNEY